MEEKKMKICPYCGKEILEVAKKCRYCGRWLDGNVPVDKNRQQQAREPKRLSPKSEVSPKNNITEDESSSNMPLILTAIIIIILLIGLIVYGISTVKQGPVSSNNLDAEDSIVEFYDSAYYYNDTEDEYSQTNLENQEVDFNIHTYIKNSYDAKNNLYDMLRDPEFKDYIVDRYGSRFYQRAIEIVEVCGPLDEFNGKIVGSGAKKGEYGFNEVSLEYDLSSAYFAMYMIDEGDAVDPN